MLFRSQFQRKLDHSIRVIDAFLHNVDNPMISCGGGKDGTAVALLAKLVGAHVNIICANPPNPLPDREAHKNELRKWLGERWIDLPYNWDVNAVLSGQKPYPKYLKNRTLSDYQERNNIDGILFGIRAAESKSRQINLALHGEIYEMGAGKRCQPIAKWNAEDSLCLALLMDAPINPIYFKLDGTGGMEQLHDGTWWPHGLEDRSGWMRRYYPDYANQYEKALMVTDCVDMRRKNIEKGEWDF